MYEVTFNPKRKKQVALSFRVEATSDLLAVVKARLQLTSCGEDYTTYKIPKVRKLKENEVSQ